MTDLIDQIMSDIKAGRGNQYRKALDAAYKSGLVVVVDGATLITTYAANGRSRRTRR